MSSIESKSLEPINPTQPMLDSIRNELSQHNIPLSLEQEKKLWMLTEEDLRLIHQELIILEKNMVNISEWLTERLVSALEKPLQQNG